MKLQIVVFFAVCAVVFGERCRHTDDCKITGCADSSAHLACIFGECTCSTWGTGSGGGTACTAASDCTCSGNLHRHCIDGHCRCTFF